MKRIVRGKKLRRGAAAVEMALVMPVLFLMLFGIIEFGWMLSVQSALVNAAREGARAGALTGGTAADMEDSVNEHLVPMGLETKVEKTLTEATVDAPEVGVELRVARSQISLLGDFFGFADGELVARCWMRKEGM